ncbi:hypothetical protein DERP_005304 [Dermatophagoides pteronyssinus]|uniref:Uncharacterized protein n=1 Tax=Dermatophagoides pteronyssinus TaxID=6956 RepID=A0ABQ8JMT7_DERPT|nr:hypothetical protein DERP_005304 [Dermatophagoides pteronyssinus]
MSLIGKKWKKKIRFSNLIDLYDDDVISHHRYDHIINIHSDTHTEKSTNSPRNGQYSQYSKSNSLLNSQTTRSSPRSGSCKRIFLCSGVHRFGLLNIS